MICMISGFWARRNTYLWIWICQNTLTNPSKFQGTFLKTIAFDKLEFGDLNILILGNLVILDIWNLFLKF